MVDYSLDGSFDLHFTDQKDLVTVKGLDEFQQELLVRLHTQLREIDTYRRRGNVEQKIELIVTRTAKEFEVINSIEKLSFRNPEDKPETLAVDVFFETGDSFTEIL